MAYKKEDLLKKAIEAIEKNNLVFMDEVCHYLPCSYKTMYDHKLHEVYELKNALEKNKTDKKKKLRDKWMNTDNATLQMALYKLLADDKERKKLSMQYQEIEHSGEITSKVIKWKPAK